MCGNVFIGTCIYTYIFPALSLTSIGLPISEATGGLDQRPRAEGGAVLDMGDHHSPSSPLLALRVHFPHWVPDCRPPDCSKKEQRMHPHTSHFITRRGTNAVLYDWRVCIIPLISRLYRSKGLGSYVKWCWTGLKRSHYILSGQHSF